MPKETYVSKLRRTKGSVVRPSTEVALAKLGKDIEFARRVRGITAEQFAASAGISRSTLHRLESGNSAGISLNTLAAVLTLLGKLDLLSNLIDMRNDDIGLSMLRANVMQGAKPLSTGRRVGKSSAGNAVMKKTTESTREANIQGENGNSVASSSEHTSSLLTRLKAARDSSVK